VVGNGEKDGLSTKELKLGEMPSSALAEMCTLSMLMVSMIAWFSNCVFKISAEYARPKVLGLRGLSRALGDIGPLGLFGLRIGLLGIESMSSRKRDARDGSDRSGVARSGAGL